MSLANLSDNSRVWFFGADRKLNESETAVLTAAMNGFVDDWTAHGKNLSAAYEFIDQCLLVVAVDESVTPPSGCSIDKVFRLVQELGGNTGVDFLNRTLIYTSQGKETKIYNRAEAENAYAAGLILPETPVFNTLITSLSEFRQRPLIPLSQSWIGRQLARKTPAI